MRAAQVLTLSAADGVPLSARLHEPAAAATPARGSVLIAGALGVRQSHYTPFADWLAGRGWRVMTFDLRGIGDSRAVAHRRTLRGVDADMLTWARQDFAAAVQALADRDAAGCVHLVGHSLGLHHAAMTTAPAQDRLALALGVASGAGYWRDWAPPSRRRAPLMLHLAVPVLAPLLGWFPGQRLGMVGDLPGPAVRQWARWCRHPDFAWGCEPSEVRPALERARFPVVAMSFTDDEAMTEHCTRRLLQAMPNAASQLVRVSPAEVGLPRIGHLGAFRPAGRELLWTLLASLLERGPGLVVNGASASPRSRSID